MVASGMGQDIFQWAWYIRNIDGQDERNVEIDYNCSELSGNENLDGLFGPLNETYPNPYTSNRPVTGTAKCLCLSQLNNGPKEDTVHEELAWIVLAPLDCPWSTEHMVKVAVSLSPVIESCHMSEAFLQFSITIFLPHGTDFLS